jgi:pimeloyl-ACP methyl ester carboxylesterase
VDFVSARTSDAGGGVSSAIHPAGFRPRSARIVLMFHGYNVNRVAGENTCNTFASLLSKYGVTQISTFGQLVGFLWPGDENIRFIGSLFYPAKIAPARDSGSLMAEFLTTLRGPANQPIQVILVAHSLGNRVALELIRALQAQSNRIWGRIEGICLMAAAVPVSFVDTNGPLANAARATRSANFFSKSDTILHWAFPPGETAAGEAFFPQAVGLFGNPPGAWTERFDLQPYNHGNYFSGQGTDDRSARYVAQFLGAAVSRQPSSAQPLTNNLPPPNNIPRRPIG